METKYIYSGLFASFVLVCVLWGIQRFFRRIRTLCLCSTVALIVVVVSETLTDIFPNSEFLLNVAAYVLFPGFGVAGGIFATFLSPFPFDNPSLMYITVSYIFTVVFYSVVFWGLVEGILYAQNKYFCSKTN